MIWKQKNISTLHTLTTLTGKEYKFRKVQITKTKSM